MLSESTWLVGCAQQVPAAVLCCALQGGSVEAAGGGGAFGLGLSFSFQCYLYLK